MTSTTGTKRARQPSKTAEGRVRQITSLAYELAEQQIRDRTASSQVITHFLKEGSAQRELELEMMKRQRDLLSAKTDVLQSAKKMENLYENAIKAFTEYKGSNDADDEEDDAYV